MENIRFHVPEEVIESLNMPKDTLSALAQEALLVRLYAMGKLDRDSLANALGITFFELIFVLKKYGITLPDPQPVNGDTVQPDAQPGNGDETQASSEHEEDPRSEREKLHAMLETMRQEAIADRKQPFRPKGDPNSEREKIRAALYEAGLLTELGPELKKIADSEPKITLEEAHAIFARNPGKSLSEIVIEQRGPLYE